MTKKIEEEFYLQASNEIEDGDTKDETWAKAFANSEGSEEKTKALYIKYRAKKLKEEDEESYVPTINDDFDWSLFWFFAIICSNALLIFSSPFFDKKVKLNRFAIFFPGLVSTLIIKVLLKEKGRLKKAKSLSIVWAISIYFGVFKIPEIVLYDLILII